MSHVCDWLRNVKCDVSVIVEIMFLRRWCESRCAQDFLLWSTQWQTVCLIFCVQAATCGNYQVVSRKSLIICGSHDERAIGEAHYAHLLAMRTTDIFGPANRLLHPCRVIWLLLSKLHDADVRRRGERSSLNFFHYCCHGPRTSGARVQFYKFPVSPVHSVASYSGGGSLKDSDWRWLCKVSKKGEIICCHRDRVIVHLILLNCYESAVKHCFDQPVATIGVVYVNCRVTASSRWDENECSFARHCLMQVSKNSLCKPVGFIKSLQSNWWHVINDVSEQVLVVVGCTAFVRLRREKKLGTVTATSYAITLFIILHCNMTMTYLMIPCHIWTLFTVRIGLLVIPHWACRW